MQVKPLRKNLYRIATAAGLLCLLMCLGSIAKAEEQSRNILCRPDLSLSHREALANRLRSITGWTKLDFDSDGAMRTGNKNEAVGGSASARELLTAAMSGPNLLVLEDASDRRDVVFARVVEARWTHDATDKPPVHLILIDFADFTHVIGDEEALAAFNEGWAVLHEIAHVVRDSVDAGRNEDVGECEALINVMRRECGVAERTDYFFNYFPGQESTPFNTRIVRLAFDLKSADTKKTKRSWIMWDGAVVGGLDTSKQVASN